MRQKPGTKQSHGEKVVRDIRRATRQQYSAEEKIRIVLDGLKGEDSIADDTVVHLRPSGNAPEFRCYAEAGSAARARALVDGTLKKVRAELG